MKLLQQFWNITSGIYTKYHYKLWYYLYYLGVRKSVLVRIKGGIRNIGSKLQCLIQTRKGYSLKHMKYRCGALPKLAFKPRGSRLLFFICLYFLLAVSTLNLFIFCLLSNRHEQHWEHHLRPATHRQPSIWPSGPFTVANLVWSVSSYRIFSSGFYR